MTKKRGRKKLEKFCLPSNDIILDQYIQTHKTEIQNHVLGCLEYAIKKDMDSVEVFQFHESPYTVNIPRDDFEENIQLIFDSFMNDEIYEHCMKPKMLIELLANK